VVLTIRKNRIRCYSRVPQRERARLLFVCILVPFSRFESTAAHLPMIAYHLSSITTSPLLALGDYMIILIQYNQDLDSDYVSYDYIIIIINVTN